MPIIDKITGIGLENVSNYIARNGIIMTSIFVTAEGYVTTAFGNMIKAGIIGGVLYFALCIRMIMNHKNYTRLIGIVIFIISFTSTVAFNMWGVWWFIIFELVQRSEEITSPQIKKRTGYLRKWSKS